VSLALVALALWALFTIDAGTAGWTAAAGRDARIFKRRYFIRAFLEGVLAGQFAFSLVALLGLVLAWRDRSLEADFVACGSTLLLVCAPFAALIGLVFAVRLVPNVDVRSLTSALFFAPITVSRPFVILAGLALAFRERPRVEIGLLAALVAIVTLGLRSLLDHRRRPAA
jgi:hypothetical protein